MNLEYAFLFGLFVGGFTTYFVCQTLRIRYGLKKWKEGLEKGREIYEENY